MRPRFVYDSYELQFSRGIQYPVEKPRQKMQVTDRTAAGTLQVEDLGIDIRTRVIAFKGLPQEDYDALQVWFATVVNGAMETFTYYDEDGEAMEVRMTSSTLNFRETSYQRFSGELTLELV